MIEGWRRLPWFQDALQNDPDSMMPPCTQCLAGNDRDVRAAQGCVWLDENPGASPWLHRGEVELGYGTRDKPVAWCARGTTSLPDVIDGAHAYRHYEKGGLASVAVLCDGRVPRTLVTAIETIDSAVAEKLIWKMKQPKDGGDAR